MLITGRSGSGKSKLLELLLYDLQRRSQAKRNFALVVLDPHGDLAKRVVSYAHNSNRERIVYVSSSINREAKTSDLYTAVINPFDNDGNEDTINILSQELADALLELLSDTQSGFTPQMQAIIRPCIATVLRSPNPSLNELKRFMLDGQNADLVALGLQSPNPQHRDFFKNDFHIDEYRLTKKSIRTKLTYFLGDQILANMLNGKSTVNLEQCLNEGRVIIFNLPKGSGKFTSSVFGRLMIAYIHSIILRRDAVPEKQRKQLFFAIDEFQNYITTSLASNLAEARKYGLSLVLATQSLKQIDNVPIRKTVMVNTGIKIVGQTDHEDRVAFAKELGLKAAELETLQPLQFYVKRDDSRNPPFKINVPILSDSYFLPTEDRAKLLHYLVDESGMYRKVPPLPMNEPEAEKQQGEKPESSSQEPQKSTGKKKQRTKNDNPFDEGLKPAF